ncbi:MAG: RNA polymerase sigma factor [Actinomycetes bacterium]
MEARSDPSTGPAAEASAPIDIQPGELSRFRSRSEARRIRTLEADTALMLELSVQGYHGHAWATVADALVAYAWAVIGAWVNTGIIHARCRSKGIHVSDPAAARRLHPHEAEELVSDTVSHALIHFRDHVLANGRWDPAKGASLSTFFIGNCLLQYPNVYRRWRRTQTARPGPLPDGHDPPTSRSLPERTLAEAEGTRELLDLVRSDAAREILQLQIDGYSEDEIAEITGLTVGAIESLVYRERKRIRQQRGQT